MKQNQEFLQKWIMIQMKSHNNNEKFFDTKKEKAAICFVENKI